MPRNRLNSFALISFKNNFKRTLIMKELLMILQQKCIKSDIQIVMHHFITSSITFKVKRMDVDVILNSF